LVQEGKVMLDFLQEALSERLNNSVHPRSVIGLIFGKQVRWKWVSSPHYRYCTADENQEPNDGDDNKPSDQILRTRIVI
jgi:hypothetical protein